MPVTRRPRRPDVGHVGRDRDRARRARRRRRRSARARRRRIRSTPRCSRRSARARCTTAPIPSQQLAARSRRRQASDVDRDARARRDRSEQPDGRGVSGEHAARADRDRRHSRRADPRRRGLQRSRVRRPRPVLADGEPRARRAGDFVLVAVEGAIVAPGWRAGWLAVGRSDRLDDVLAAIKKLADGRALQPGADAVRHRGGADRRPRRSPARVRARAARARRPDDERGSATFPASAASRRRRRSTRCRR